MHYQINPDLQLRHLGADEFDIIGKSVHEFLRVPYALVELQYHNSFGGSLFAENVRKTNLASGFCDIPVCSIFSCWRRFYIGFWCKGPENLIEHFPNACHA
jgi:hypothetical protein